jgi:3-deoxy-D-manno-octulosonic acid kinase
VLRHYYRGGLPGKFLADRYFWFGESRVRSFREWDLLCQMRMQGLPVPAPVAARYVHHGLTYCADLITVRLPDVVTLSVRLAQGHVGPRLWQQLGACIAQFHSAGFCHADLNAHNVQIDSNDAIYLLDWDRGERRASGGWQQGNLARLHHSLDKLSPGGSLPLADWQAVINGYVDNFKEPPA